MLYWLMLILSRLDTVASRCSHLDASIGLLPPYTWCVSPRTEQPRSYSIRPHLGHAGSTRDCRLAGSLTCGERSTGRQWFLQSVSELTETRYAGEETGQGGRASEAKRRRRETETGNPGEGAMGPGDGDDSGRLAANPLAIPAKVGRLVHVICRGRYMARGRL